MKEHSTRDPHPWSKGSWSHWPSRLPPAQGPAAELCRCDHVSPPIFPLGSFASSCHVHGSLFFLSLFLTLADTHSLPAASPALYTPLSATQQWNQPTGIRAAFFLFLPKPMPSITTVPGDTQPVLRPPACPAAPFLGHAAGKQVHGAGRRVEWGGQRSS